MAFESARGARCIRRAVLCLMGCTGSAALYAQEPPQVNVFSFADTSCAAWERSRDDEPLRTVYGVWFRGFVSGYNFGNSPNQVAPDNMPDPPALARYVDAYCREHPNLPFIGAAIPLIQELREFRSALPPR